MKLVLIPLLCAAACGELALRSGNTGGGSARGGASGGGAEVGGGPGTGGSTGGSSSGGGSTSLDAGNKSDAGFQPPFDWIGIVGTGQSLSIGYAGTPLLGTQPSFNNLTLVDNGPTPRYPSDGGGVWAIVPLREPLRAKQTDQSTLGQYPNNLLGETPHTAMASELTQRAKANGANDYVTVHSVVGWSGHCLRDINKTGAGGVVGRAYPASIAEAHAFKRLAQAARKSFGYAAVVLTHGECDAANPNYEQGLVQLQRDYDADLRAITGQQAPVRLFLSQHSTFAPVVNGNAPVVGSLVSMWRACVNNPGKIICTGPKYQYAYVGDRIHLNAASYRALGEKYAQVIDAVVNRGETFRPLEPSSATRQSNVVSVNFHVPEPPLAFEESLAPPHQSGTWVAWKNGRGFEVVDSSGPQTISSASISGNTVRLTLSTAPTGTGLRVRYAVVQDGTGYHGGSPDGRRGQLRDSGRQLGADKQTLQCSVTHNSTRATCPAALMATRNLRDRVFGSGLPADGAVVTALANGNVTLSSAWQGSTGTVSLTLAYDLRNYAVHFDIPVE